MKRFLCSVSLLLFVVFFYSCSSVQVKTNQEPSANFSNYQTFAMAKPKPNPHAPFVFSTINQNRLSRAISHEMELRDYKPAANPDLMISFYLKVKEQTDVYSRGGGYGYYGYDRGGYTNTSHYKVGTLIVDFVDVKNQKLVWQGVAIGVLPQKSKDPEKKIQKTVNQIMKKYTYLAGGETIQVAK